MSLCCLFGGFPSALQKARIDSEMFPFFSRDFFSCYIPRVGQRGAGLSATIARSEHEISEIIDGLSEQEVRTGKKKKKK